MHSFSPVFSLKHNAGLGDWEVVIITIVAVVSVATVIIPISEPHHDLRRVNGNENDFFENVIAWLSPKVFRYDGRMVIKFVLDVDFPRWLTIHCWPPR